ncbi:squamous cell carcinoma antigen recognized by t-cells 3 [Phtheirospermum japonicum]|uniref:Squamous cell carcinoma antigen recognized by t-cells 3 n=1 Tax=Phtheirospermum japonicum TaxID=374723 RepID=A0A830B8M6_9LAMI|nr:squamous cell carcinoma antigen recognized by t-cells 3 [Phtheirospermum japonicum]
MAESETLVAAQPPAVEEDANRNEDQPMPDVQNPSDASDSGSDSDSDDEAQAKAQIEALETALNGNPTDYDNHVQYIKILRKQGDIEKLRQARETMSSLFPLIPGMWREWAKDETTISSGADAFSAVEKLYERGVSDYLSVPLWCDYLNFVQEHDPSVRECSASGISKARNLFERALTAAGLHVAEGHKIWELYREFEQAILFTIEESDSGSLHMLLIDEVKILSVFSNANACPGSVIVDKAREKQIQRIRNLFHRQLSIPLADLKSTLLAYKAWEADNGSSNDVNSSELDGLSSHVVSVYQKALEMLSARANFEENISKKDVDSGKLQEFMVAERFEDVAYLKFEYSFGDPARIQILYERAVADFPISTDLWIEYTQYLDKTFKTARIVRDAYYRATRNCHWVGELWVRYLLSLERSHGSEEELSTVFEKSVQCTFSSFDEYLDIFLTRVDGLRRRLSSTAVEDGVDYAVIRDIFQMFIINGFIAMNILLKICSYSLLIVTVGQHAFLLFYSSEHAKVVIRYWARLESKLGKDLIAARGVWESLLKMLKNSGSMLEAWLGYIAWEIEMGHINEARSLYKRSYSKKFPGTGSEDICHSWVRFEREYGALEHFDIAVQKVAPRLQELQLFRLQQESKNAGLAKYERENPSTKNAREKRKPISSSADEQSPAKRRKDTDQNLKKTNENDKAQAGHSAAASKAAKIDEKKSESSSQETKHKPSKKSFDDQCTATDNDLRNFFADVGGVVAVRILKDKFTRKSREKNKQILLGKRVSILKSDPQQGRKKVAERSIKPEHGNAAKQIDDSGKTDSQEASKERKEEQSQSSSSSLDKDVQLKGRNTFAVPRNVIPLGRSTRFKPQSDGAKEQDDDENPKSNDEFRKMFIKK